MPVEPVAVRLASMTFQSSFFIRCRKTSQAGATPVMSYYIQHVQTSAEFRSTSLSEINAWMTEQNALYFNRIAENSESETENDAAEDSQ